MSLRGIAAAVVLLSAWLSAQRVPFLKTPKTCNVEDLSKGSLEVISGPAIEGWQFEPPMRYGEPIEMAIQIQVTFHLK